MSEEHIINRRKRTSCIHSRNCSNLMLTNDLRGERRDDALCKHNTYVPDAIHGDDYQAACEMTRPMVEELAKAAQDTSAKVDAIKDLIMGWTPGENLHETALAIAALQAPRSDTSAVGLVRESVEVLLDEMSYRHKDCSCRQCAFITKAEQWLKDYGGV